MFITCKKKPDHSSIQWSFNNREMTCINVCSIISQDNRYILGYRFFFIISSSLWNSQRSHPSVFSDWRLLLRPAPLFHGFLYPVPGTGPFIFHPSLYSGEVFTRLTDTPESQTGQHQDDDQEDEAHQLVQRHALARHGDS